MTELGIKKLNELFYIFNTARIEVFDATARIFEIVSLPPINFKVLFLMDLDFDGEIVARIEWRTFGITNGQIEHLADLAEAAVKEQAKKIIELTSTTHHLAEYVIKQYEKGHDYSEKGFDSRDTVKVLDLLRKLNGSERLAKQKGFYKGCDELRAIAMDLMERCSTPLKKEEPEMNLARSENLQTEFAQRIGVDLCELFRSTIISLETWYHECLSEDEPLKKVEAIVMSEICGWRAALDGGLLKVDTYIPGHAGVYQKLCRTKNVEYPGHDIQLPKL